MESPAEPLVCQCYHGLHDAHWLLESLPSPLCLACALETLREDGASLVRKNHVLSCLHDVLTRHAALVIPLLAQDERVCVHSIGTLFGILRSMEDSHILDLSIEVLVMLVVKLKLEGYLNFLLKECQQELCKVTTTRGSLPILILLGKLADVIPIFADELVIEHSSMLEHLATCLMYPNEKIKAAVCYLYGKLCSAPNAVERLYVHFTERLCDLFLTTLKNAQTRELQLNCMGLLNQLLKYDHFVSVTMGNSGKGTDSASPELFERESLLPLMLKKLLLSRDELLQVASAQCIAAVLVHSPAKYAPAFIHADVPGIEPVLKSLKEILHLNNVELHKQGLLLLTEILKRQPAEIKLFTNTGVLKDAISVLVEAVNCPVLEVATEAVKAVAAFLRKDHVSFPPEPYGDLQKLIESVLKQCSDLQMLPPNRGLMVSLSFDCDWKIMGHAGAGHQSRAVSRHGQFIQSALESFRNACRLAMECQNDPLAQENPFIAPDSEKKDTLKSFSEFLLRISDSLCIPIVMSYSERIVRPALMEVFISTLNMLFNVVPDMGKRFSIKLASSCFIRLNLELKAKFCIGQSNPALNQACSSFLHSMCLNLHSSCKKMAVFSQEEQEISELLQRNLPQLNYGVAESLTLLSEPPNSYCLDDTLRSHQYSLLLLIYFAFSQEDRFIPETELFSAIRSFLLSLQHQGDCPPAFVFRAVLYLLGICQDKTEALDLASLSAIKRILDVTSDFTLVYVHHPLLLKFFLFYPELMGRFGHRILQLWFLCEDYSQFESQNAVPNINARFDSSNYLNSFLCMLKDNPSALLVLLDLVCQGPEEVTRKVLVTLETFLKRNEDVFVCDLLRSQFLQILQKRLVENSYSILQENQTLPLLLNLLFLVQLRYVSERELDSTDFRLLHLVSNLSGKCSPTDFEFLQPSLNFLYWSLQQTTPSSQQRVVAMLLSNMPLLELLERVLQLTWMLPVPSPSETAFSTSNEALLCSAWLLTAALLTQQHIYKTEVHHVICLEVDQVFCAVAFKKKKPTLFFVSILLFLRAFLRQNLSSSLVKFVVHQTDKNGKDLASSKEDATLFPLATWHVLSLVISLQNLLVQKDLLLSQTVIGCLEILLEYLHGKNQDIETTHQLKMSKQKEISKLAMAKNFIQKEFLASHVVSQPWNKFLLITLLDGGENSFLHPEILRLVTLCVQYQNTSLISQTEISHILEEAANTKLSDLPEATVSALHSFVLQLQNGKCQLDSSQRASIQNLLESLPSTSRIQQTHQSMVCLGGVAVSLSHIRD